MILDRPRCWDDPEPGEWWATLGVAGLGRGSASPLRHPYSRDRIPGPMLRPCCDGGGGRGHASPVHLVAGGGYLWQGEFLNLPGELLQCLYATAFGSLDPVNES